MAPPSKKKISHNKHLSLHSLVSMSTLMAPTHRIVPVPGSGQISPRATTPETAPYFALSHIIQGRLRRIFDELRGSDEVLSKDKLVAFLRKTQRQEIELPEGAEKGFTYEQWLSFLWMKGGLEGLRPLEKGKKDLSRPISNYYISSSHNTYLDGNQWFSKSNTDAYRFVRSPSPLTPHLLLKFLYPWEKPREKADDGGWVGSHERLSLHRNRRP